MAQWLDRIKFGNGHDGSPNGWSGNLNSFATCTGTATQSSLTTALSASAGDVILIHQTQGTGAGQWEINYVLADAGATLTLAYPLAYTYGTGAQVVGVPQSLGGNISGAITATDWNGSVGGIIALMSNGDLTISGSLKVNGAAGGYGGGLVAGATGGGFRGGAGRNSQVSPEGDGSTGEGTVGVSVDAQSAANGNGGGAGVSPTQPSNGGGGGGGGNGGTGGTGNKENAGTGGTGGGTAGAAALTTMVFGGGGGGGGYGSGAGSSTTSGSSGGGIVFIISKTIIVSGSIQVNGGDGNSTSSAAGGGAGAGGSVLIKSMVATLGSSLITVTGGTAKGQTYSQGGNAGVGRIHLDYYSSYSGSATGLDVAQDTNFKPAVYGGMI